MLFYLHIPHRSMTARWWPNWSPTYKKDFLRTPYSFWQYWITLLPALRGWHIQLTVEGRQEGEWLSVQEGVASSEWSVVCPNLVLCRKDFGRGQQKWMLSNLMAQTVLLILCCFFFFLKGGFENMNAQWLRTATILTSGQWGTRNEHKIHNNYVKCFHPLVAIYCLSLLHPWPAPAQYSLPLSSLTPAGSGPMQFKCLIPFFSAAHFF